MAQLLLINPRRRRKARKSARRRSRGARKMSALQMKYFGKRRSRRSAIHANPKRRRRSVARSAPRRRQRGFARVGGARLPRIGFNVGALQSAAKSAALGATGALAVDVLMGQAGRVLPEGWMSRFNADGSVNWPYYLAKMGLAVGVGVLGAKFARGYSGVAQQMALGSITVQGYELLRAHVPADFVTLGYYSPARVASMNGLRGRALGYYQSAPGAMSPRFGTSLSRLHGMNRVGSGRIGS